MSRRSSRRGLPSTSGVLAPADRHYRRPDVRPGRRRRLGQRLWQAGRLVAVLLAVSAAAFWAGRAVVHSPLLNVDRIVVRGNARLSSAEVATLLADLKGQHILDIDFGQYQRRLLDSPWVASVTLWRLLPSTVEVTVVERSPMAIARLGEQLYLVDHTGIIIDDFGPDYSDLDLPLVDGLMRQPGGDGSIVDAERVDVTARFLAALEARPDLGRRVSLVDVSNAHDVVVLLDAEATWLHLGDQQFVERLDRYLDIAPTLDGAFTGIDYVDLRFEQLSLKARGRTQPEAFERRP